MVAIRFDLPEIITEKSRFKLKKGLANISLTVSFINKRNEQDRLLEAFLVKKFECTVRQPINDFASENLNNEEVKVLKELGNDLRFNDNQARAFIKALVQAPIIDPKPKEILRIQYVIINGLKLNLFSMVKTTNFGGTVLDTPAENKIIPPINNIYQIIPALMEISTIGDELTNKTELDNFINELVDITDERRRLIILVDSLINNIEMGSKGRKTSGLGSDKVHSLNTIYEKLKDLDQPINTAHCLNQIEKICDQKRNRLHWWGKPHSAEEFKTLIVALKLKELPVLNHDMKR